MLGAQTAALSWTLAPHVALADALLGYETVRSAEQRDPTQARGVAAELEAVAPTNDRDGVGPLAFAARIAAAEVLDLADLEAAAVERWLALLESNHLTSAQESVQVAIAVRLKGYTDRLREDLTRRTRAEEQALADEKIRELQTQYATLSQEQRTRVEALEAEVARIPGQTQAQVRDNLATQRARFEGTLEHQEERIRELESLFANVAIAHAPGAPKDSVDAATSAVSVAADVVTIWTAANRSRFARPASAASGSR